MIFGTELVVFHTTPSMFSKFSVPCLKVVGRVEVRTKNILNRFTENETHFGMPRGAKMSLTLKRTEIGCSSFNFKHYLRACPTNGKKLSKLYVKQPMENHRGPTPKQKSY